MLLFCRMELFNNNNNQKKTLKLFNANANKAFDAIEYALKGFTLKLILTAHQLEKTSIIIKTNKQTSFGFGNAR